MEGPPPSARAPSDPRPRSRICSAKLQARAQPQQRRAARTAVVASADNRAAAGFAAAALAAAVLINAPVAHADLVRGEGGGAGLGSAGLCSGRVLQG